MRKITSITELKESIQLLEIRQADDAYLLKEQLLVTYEKLKPINLIKNSIKDLLKSPDLKNGLINTTMGIAAGYLSKKAVVGSTHNPIKQLLGTLVQLGVTNIVSKNSEDIKSIGISLISSFLRKKSTAD